ncbi:MAG: hypothetical protein EPO13_05175 [Actinomycetota bacterium]|nr:MAG: hypothetical protein EPO13_05175 [Actinomycetota bacterium]
MTPDRPDRPAEPPVPDDPAAAVPEDLLPLPALSDADDAFVRDTLASLGTPELPAAVATRLDAALAAAAAARTATPAGQPGSGSAGAASPEAASPGAESTDAESTDPASIEAESARAAQTGERAAARPGRHAGPVTDLTARRRGRLLPILTAAAGIAVVAGAGVLLAPRLGDPGTTAASGDPTASPGVDSGSPAAVVTGTSGTAYSQENVVDQVKTMLVSHRVPVSPPALAALPSSGSAAMTPGGTPAAPSASGTGVAPTGPAASGPAPMATTTPPRPDPTGPPVGTGARLQHDLPTDSTALRDCVTGLTGDPVQRALLVDRGTYGGSAAVVVVLAMPDPAKVDVWVVGLACSRGDQDVRYFVRVAR